MDPLGASPENISWSSYSYVWGNPVSTIDPDGRSGETVNDEYRAIHKSDGTVEYEWMSSEGGNERDIIHHTDEYAVPDKRHREWVEVVENPFGGLGERYKPGVWFSPLAKGTATVTDSPIEWVIDLPKVLAAKSAMLVLSLVKRGADDVARVGAKKFLMFSGDEAVTHFAKHADQIMKVSGKSTYNLKNYVEDANWIIKNGEYSKELNGYFYFMGNSSKGESLFGFVGLKNSGLNISTFHVKSASQLGLK